MRKTLLTILTTVIGGLLLWYLTEVYFAGSKPPPPQPPGFAERLPGTYRLQSWTETRDGPVEFGITAVSGQLSIAADGTARWSLSLQDRFFSPATGGITCVGQVDFANRQLQWVPGSGNSAIDWHSNIESMQAEVWPAFCGGSAGSGADPFTLSLDSDTILQMRNGHGIFTWTAN